MKTSSFLIILLFSGAVFGGQTKSCEKPTDCLAGEYCVLGMERYSIPQCKPMGKPNDWCRKGAAPEDRILYYPNADIRRVEGVYTLFSPCQEGLACEKGRCQKQSYANAKANAVAQAQA